MFTVFFFLKQTLSKQNLSQKFKIHISFASQNNSRDTYFNTFNPNNLLNNDNKQL